ncbi:hypothetical protein GALMADRAFT_232447 [Galerina marginata CBS 339.88]|uniref:Uncharacterized protein n=1 Tax=Galerina marginata (strain CBS 339.88) TaxID=685588 RepID=A0A067S6W2_GALM3|nr:hypothetical protein GALMADRAFT_232447 [Galerina marginata CBS 339.88]
MSSPVEARTCNEPKLGHKHRHDREGKYRHMCMHKHRQERAQQYRAPTPVPPSASIPFGTDGKQDWSTDLCFFFLRA